MKKKFRGKSAAKLLHKDREDHQPGFWTRLLFFWITVSGMG